MVVSVTKRTGISVPFDSRKIQHAIYRCIREGLGLPEEAAHTVAEDVQARVVNILESRGDVTTVEGIQDLVEEQLIAAGEISAARAYIRYRDERARNRRSGRALEASEELKALVALDRQFFPTELQYYQFLSKYARYDWKKKRRETWAECVQRTISFFQQEIGEETLTQEEWRTLYNAILQLRVMPSMRLLQMAGPAASRDNLCGYNCCYTPTDDLRAFAEVLYLLMGGSGVGFSVESRYIDELLRVRKQKGNPPVHFVIEDTTEGWCDALLFGLENWVTGEDVDFEYSLVRPAGTPLLTKGGTSSGPEPLKELLDFTRRVVLARQGRRLRPIDCHDIACYCVPEDTWIMTSEGPKKVADLVGVPFDAVVDGKPYPSSNAGFFKTGELPVYEVSTTKGFKFQATGNHRVLVQSVTGREYRTGRNKYARAWKRVDALTPQDDLVLHNHQGFSWDGSGTMDEGWLLGNLLGDGNLDRRGQANLDYWGSTAEQMVPVVVTRVHETVGARGSLRGYVMPRGNYRVQSKGLYKLAAAYGMEPGNKTCTEAVEKTSSDFHRGFLRGWFDADGSAVKGTLGVHVSLSSSVPSNLEAAQRMLARLGIVGAIYKGRSSREIYIENRLAHTKPEFSLRICGANVEEFARRVGFSDPEKSDKLSRLLEVRAGQRYSREKFAARVRCVTPVGAQSVYDCQIFDASAFDANGVYLHNCGRIVQVGGVRRAAQISLFDPDDELMRTAKHGEFWSHSPQRTQANNSIAFEETPTCEQFLESLWLPLIKGNTGEPGIFNRRGALHSKPKRRKRADFGCNPCGEVDLRPRGLCNLSVCVVHPDDGEESLQEKIVIATILGTLQSKLTRFNYVRDEWRQNAEEERLLGVDICGWQDNPLLRYGAPGRVELMERLRATAIETNRVWAERLGINQSAAVTCTKPAGNSATLLGTSSGISPRESPYYIRHVRAERSNPLTQLLQDAGVPWHPEVGQNLKNYRTCVFAFPVAAPENAITYDDMSARDQFLNWLEIKKHYTEHNPSVTLRVGSEEWMELGYLVYQNWDCVGGLSFLPRSDFIYQLAPYQRITKEEYERLASAFPKIPWERLPLYEGEADNTTARQEYACSAGGSCDI